jgi:putative phage-type endonuclease
MSNIERETIRFTDQSHWLQLRTEDITSTEIPALFGLSPYATPFEVWHAKSGGFRQEFVATERTAWGNRLEREIAKGAAEENKWKIRRFKTYGRLKGLRIGSSFDYEITAPKKYAGILECKNLDGLVFRQGWIQDGDKIEAPPHIELQVQHQMLVSGCEQAIIAGLVGGNTLKLIRRPADLEIQTSILKKCEQFWESIDKNQEPEPDLPPDAGFIAKLYAYANPGTMEDMSDNEGVMELCVEYKRAAGIEATARGEKSTAKAKLLLLIGENSKILANQYTISAGMVAPKRVEAYDKKGYRNFRVTERKEK